MSRRHSAEKREIIPDAKYGDIVVAKFMNTITRVKGVKCMRCIGCCILDTIYAISVLFYNNACLQSLVH